MWLREREDGGEIREKTELSVPVQWISEKVEELRESTDEDEVEKRGAVE